MSPPRICLVTRPAQKAGIRPLSNLVNILRNIGDDLCLLTGNEGRVVCEAHPDISSCCITQWTGRLPVRIIGHLVMQLELSCRLVKHARKADLCIFFMTEGLVLPMLICKVMRKPAILALAASTATLAKHDEKVFAKPWQAMETVNYRAADKIVVYSDRLVSEWGLERYRKKTAVAHEHFLNFDEFQAKKRLGERELLVGYIGRLSEEKGVMNFVRAIPEVLRQRPDVRFQIGGSGQQAQEIRRYLDQASLGDNTELLGWISSKELPRHLNELRLLVLPSYTEGLPNIMLEAMACGTPVLATPVGTIPDVIRDGDTGFIMENNSPACIEENVLRALDSPDLDRIAHNARAFVKTEFSFERAVEKYRKVLSDSSAVVWCEER